MSFVAVVILGRDNKAMRAKSLAIADKGSTQEMYSLLYSLYLYYLKAPVSFVLRRASRVKRVGLVISPVSLLIMDRYTIDRPLHNRRAVTPEIGREKSLKTSTIGSRTQRNALT